MNNPVASSSKLTLSSPFPSEASSSTPRRRRRDKGDVSITPSSLGRQRSSESARKSRRTEEGLTPTQPRRVKAVSTLLARGEERATPVKKRKKKRDRQNVDLEVVDGDDDDDDDGEDVFVDDGVGRMNYELVAESENGNIPMVWSDDGRYYFKAKGSSIMIHSSVAPEYSIISTLPPPSTSSYPSSSTSSLDADAHTHPVTAFSISPLNPLHIITASSDGTLKIWDWTEGRLITTIDVGRKKGLRVGRMCVGLVGGKGKVWVGACNRDGGSDLYKPHQIYEISLSRFMGTKQPVKTLIREVPRAISTLSLSPNGRYLLATSFLNLHVLDVDTKTWCTFTTTYSITTSAWFPGGNSKLVPTFMQGRQENWFATGDYKGQVRLWHGLEEAFRNDLALKAQGRGGDDDEEDIKGKLPCTVWHWHSHAVQAMAFSSTGAQLLTGGEENVLVKWEIESGRKDFVPRLGSGGIQSIGVKSVRKGGDQEEYWVTMKDGSVMKNLTGTGAATGVGRAVRLDPVYSPSNGKIVPLATHKPTGCFVLPSSHPSTIQFYNPVTNTVLFDLEVAPSNRVSRREDNEVEPVRVERVVFYNGPNGKAEWMATSESRDGDEVEGGGKARAVKVWRWDGITKTYALNTHLPRAHGSADITALSFCDPPSVAGPSRRGGATDPFLLTTSSDGTAKLWAIKSALVALEMENVKKGVAEIKESFWALRSTFSYRDLPINAACVSPDSSLIVLAHPDALTLWDTQSNVMLRILDGAVRNIRDVGFVGGTGRWIAAIGKVCGVYVWDLLSAEVSWCDSSSNAISLLASPSSPYFVTTESRREGMVVNAADTRVSIWDPTSSSPLSTRKLPFALSAMSWGQLQTEGVTSPSDLQFIALGGPRSLPYRIGENVAPLVQPIKALRPGQSVEEIKRTTIWEEMFGKGSLGDLPTDVHVKSVDELSARAIEKRSRYSTVFDGPAYTLPPVDLLFDKFLDDFLGLATSTNGSTDSADAASAQVSNEIVYADSTAPSIDLDVAMAEGKVFVDDGMVLPDKGKKAKVVSDADVEELSGWFKDVLAPLTSNTTQPIKSVINISTPTPASAPSTPSISTPSKTTNLPSRPAIFVMPEFSAKKRKEKEAAAAAGSEGVEGQKVGSKRKARTSEV